MFDGSYIILIIVWGKVSFFSFACALQQSVSASLCRIKFDNVLLILLGWRTEFFWLGNGCGDEPSGCIEDVAE
jgi:hypothetical protein